MSGRATRIALVAIVAVKVLLLLAGRLRLAEHPSLNYLDRTVNFVLLVAAAVWLYRLTRMARGGALWSVSRRLLVSYILIGAVPILLLITFSTLAFAIVFFDIGGYLVQSRVNELTEQAATFARTTLYEIERAPASQYPEIVARREAAIQATHPGGVVKVFGMSGHPCAAPSKGDEPGTLPKWIDCKGFSGIIEGHPDVARAVALPASRTRAAAVVVDVPIQDALTASLEGTGIQIGNERRPSLFNTATFLVYTDWDSGETREVPLQMNMNLAMLYRWLGSTQGARASFSQLLLVLLLSVGALLFVIEMVAFGSGLGLARSITAAVDDLFQGTERVKAGEFQHAIAVRGDDQLGELAVSFNDMTGRIRELLVEQNEKRRLEEELRIARNIQMSLLPQGPLSVPGLSIAALCAPAREVGGDYYDLFPLDDNRIGVLIADVAGKGTSAALYMAELKGLMLSLSRIHTSPRDLLVEANRIISRQLESGSFITMIYAVIDVERRTLTCARAGHTPFIRIPEVATGERRARVLAPDGMVLGLNFDRGETFERLLKEVTLPLCTGDLFFFFTDGISEAMDRDGNCFGESRLSSMLEKYADQPADEIRNLVFQEVAAFVGGQAQHDDITMIILKAA